MTDSLNRRLPGRAVPSDRAVDGTHRTFFDTDAVEWKVWEVTPSSLESAGGAVQGFVEPLLQKGWLCFESIKGEKRRFAPVPPDWARHSFQQMIELWRQATPVRKPSA